MVRTRTIWGNDVFDVWAAGVLEIGYNRSHGNVFFWAIGQSRTIYSYGTHFPMGVRQPNGDFILNGDTYSSSTSRHQTATRTAAHKAILRQGHGKVLIIPFSSLRQTGATPYNMDVVDVEKDRNVVTPCNTAHKPRGHFERVPGNYRQKQFVAGKVNQASDYDMGRAHVHEQHLMGRSVFKLTAYGKDMIALSSRYFISGMDETARNVWRSHFLSELPGYVDTVAQAIESLKPEAVHDYEQRYILAGGMCAIAQPEVVRQGEWFFIPRPDVQTKTLRPIPLPDKSYVDRDGNTHIIVKVDRLLPVGPGTNARRAHQVTELRRDSNGQLYARGSVIHTRREHKRLALGKVWHSVHMNTAKGSWSGGGRVD